MTCQPGPPDDRLPRGFTVRLDPAVIRADGGRTLFGGSPARLLYLRPQAERLLAHDELQVTDDPASGLLARLLLDKGMAQPVLPPASPAGEGAEVTVVVPVKDRPVELARLLAALGAAEGPVLDVIVVDDGSAAESNTARVARRAGAVVIRHPLSRGPAAARNTGLRRVRTPLVAFIDSDVVPRPGWLETLLPHFTDPAVGLVAPRVTGTPSAPHQSADQSSARSANPNAARRIVAGLRARMTRWVSAYEESRSSLDLGSTPAMVAPRGRVSYVPTATVLARTAALGDGFDETMQVGEDVDLVWRLVEAGWRVRYEPAAQVQHDHRVVVRDWLRRKAFYGTSAAPLAIRHPGAVPPLAAAPWSAGVWALLLLQRRWAAAGAVGIAALATVRLAGRLERSEHPLKAAIQLAPWALTNTGWQTASALTRHWWPLTAAACLVSRRARRAALASAVIEALADRHRVTTSLGPIGYTLAHRLDDLAYGAGLWLGAWRSRTLAPLLPALSGRASPVPPPGERPRTSA